MKITDVVSQLRKLVPQLTDLFSDSLEIADISGDGAIVSVHTNEPHNLETGDYINVAGVRIKTPLDRALRVGDGVEFQAVRATDLTLGWPPHEFVELGGFANPVLNASFKLLSSLNRNIFKVEAQEVALPEEFNGNEYLLENVLGKFNGPALANVIDANNFTYESEAVGEGLGGFVKSNIRITGMATLIRVDKEYTEQEKKDWWMYVTAIEAADVDKSRRTETDLDNESGPNTDFQSYIIDGFNIYVYANSSESSGGLDVMDTARSEVLKALLSSIRGFKLPTVLSAESNQVVNLRTHGIAKYTGAVYAHEYVFQAPELITGDDIVLDETVAFRDVDFTTDKMTVAIDLDKDPSAQVPVTLPSQVPDLKAWFDADAAETIVTNQPGQVIRWLDKSGEGNAIAIPPAGIAPLTGANTINEKNVITFSGAESLFRDNFNGGALGQPNTMFIVLRLSDDAVDTDIFIDSTFSNQRNALFATPVRGLSMYGGALISSNADAIKTGHPYLFGAEFNGAMSKGYINKALTLMGNAGPQSMGGIILGASSFNQNHLNGDIAEVCIYNRKLNEVETKALQDYFYMKWGITQPPPTPGEIQGIKLWLDADDPATITEETTGVSGWADKSGNGNDLSQPNPNEQPFNGAVINGRNALEFNQTNSIGRDAFVEPIDQPGTVFILYRQEGRAIGRIEYLLDSGPADSSANVTISNEDDEYVEILLYAGINYGVFVENYSEREPNFIRAEFNGAESKIYDALDDYAETGNAGGFGMTGIRLARQYGAEANYFDGLVGEVLIYDRILTAQEIEIVQNYLTEKWGI